MIGTELLLVARCSAESASWGARGSASRRLLPITASAYAQAASLRYLRNYRVYKTAATSWKEFCPKYLNMSSAQADDIIRLYEEFGGEYFELAQLTRVSVETYRAMEPHIENHVLHYIGEEIPLHPENAARLDEEATPDLEPIAEDEDLDVVTYER